MDKKTQSTYIRLPDKLKDLIKQYARKKGFEYNQAIIHILARGLHFSECAENFHIEQYTENFFLEDVRNDEKS